MILGGDPHKAEPIKVDTQKINMYVDKFNFLCRKYNSGPIPLSQIGLFRKYINHMIMSGVSYESLNTMTREFFAKGIGANKACPWKLFVSKDVQRQLTKTSLDIAPSDAVLAWVASDFTVVDNLPWERTDDKWYRRAVLTYTDLLYRYPECVAKALSDHPPKESLRILDILTEMLDVRLDSAERKDLESQLSAVGFTTPKSLQRSASVRQPATTLAEAVTRLSARSNPSAQS